MLACHDSTCSQFDCTVGMTWHEAAVIRFVSLPQHGRGVRGRESQLASMCKGLECLT